ncbi:NAD-binding protein [Antarctobacter sp.]|uniref:NAD-binding protein n=1 Tax=Antarctobacter sp. TaxID=1872577 RepID=UPI003A8ECF16
MRRSVAGRAARPAASGKLAIWVGGDKAAYDRHAAALDAMADQPKYIGECGAGTIAKLAHNMASSAIKVVLGEVMTMGVKAGLDPLPLWEAMRTGGAGRMRGFDNIQRFLEGNLDPASFAIRLMQKDVGLALELGRELDVPMRMCNLVGQDLSEAINRGWDNRDSQALLVLQQERSGIAEIRIDAVEIKAAMARS